MLGARRRGCKRRCLNRHAPEVSPQIIPKIPVKISCWAMTSAKAARSSRSRSTRMAGMALVGEREDAARVEVFADRGPRRSGGPWRGRGRAKEASARWRHPSPRSCDRSSRPWKHNPRSSATPAKSRGSTGFRGTGKRVCDVSSDGTIVCAVASRYGRLHADAITARLERAQQRATANPR